MTTLAAGARISHFQILEPIGAGGMGEVYKATDTRLDRIVAIKVLPSHWAANDEMRQRFEREAQALASLNHPHICVLHDIGKHADADFLVMEHLEGETLAKRLERGAIPLDEALKLGLEMADALDKAHRKGITHRDLKPSNVMLTLQYMAPEQVEGLEADARTDIFAFGSLLHEMVTGKRAFEAKSRVLLIAAIATFDPPPLSSVEPAAPAALDHIVKTCLAKEPADRWQTARDLLAELEWISEGGADAPAAVPIAAASARRVWLTRGLFAGAALVAGALVTSAFLLVRRPSTPDELRFRVPIQLAAETTVAGGRGNNAGSPQGYQGVSGPSVFSASSFAISPDGRLLAFVARQLANDPWSLYVRPVGAVTPQKLPGTDGATQPFWSDDSRAIAFVSSGKLRRVEASGGPPQEICDAAGFFGGTWNSAGVIIFGAPQGLMRVAAEGGKPESITKLEESETGHYWPHFLPDGRHYLYTAWSGKAASRAVVARTLDSPDQTRVLPAGSNAGYAEAGYLVFHRESAVYAQSFDASKLTVSGEPVRVADEVTFDASTGQGFFSVGRKGGLAYFFNSSNTGAQGSPANDLSEWQLSWISRTAQNQELVGPQGVYRGVDVSPDTKRIAVHRHDANGGDIVVFEPRGSDTRLTFDASQHNSMPIFSPDGNQIVFASLRNGKWGLYQTLSTRSGSEQMLFESELPCAPMSWSPDRKRIVFWVQDPKTAGDLWVLELEGDKKASKLVATPFNEIHAQISPDGKWLAYTDNSKDNRNEIYVQPFPSGSGRYQISTNSGDWPRWRGDSKELFYHSIGLPATPALNAGPIAFSSLLYSVPISVNGGVLEPGSPRELVVFPTLNLPHSGGRYHTYAVSPDGERFLIMQFVPPTTATSASQIGPDTSSGLTVALNWTSALKK